jgi:hypothetical protein
MAEEKNKQQEEQLREEQLDEVNGGYHNFGGGRDTPSVNG